MKDIRLGKQWEPYAYFAGVGATIGNLAIPVSSARRRITFAVTGDSFIVTPGAVNIYYAGDSRDILLFSLTAQVPYHTMEIERDGKFIFGPFRASDPLGVGSSVYITELRANENEDDA